MGPRKTVTSLDVARAAGVSRSAVSRSFTEGASVSDKRLMAHELTKLLPILVYPLGLAILLHHFDQQGGGGKLELVLNIVRLRYRDTPFFLEVGSVTSQYPALTT